MGSAAFDGHLDLGDFGCRGKVANRLIISENVCNALLLVTYASFQRSVEWRTSSAIQQKTLIENYALLKAEYCFDSCGL